MDLVLFWSALGAIAGCLSAGVMVAPLVKQTWLSIKADNPPWLPVAKECLLLCFGVSVTMSVIFILLFVTGDDPHLNRTEEVAYAAAGGLFMGILAGSAEFIESWRKGFPASSNADV